MHPSITGVALCYKELDAYGIRVEGNAKSDSEGDEIQVFWKMTKCWYIFNNVPIFWRRLTCYLHLRGGPEVDYLNYLENGGA